MYNNNNNNMKINKTISLDLEIVEKLQKEDNASNLINNLLTNFFSINKVPEDPRVKLQKMKEFIKEQQEIIDKIEEKLPEVELEYDK